MANVPYHVQAALDANRPFRISDYVSEGYNIAKQNWGGFIGYFILMGFISIAIQFVPFVGGLIGSIVAPALTMGFAVVAHRIKHNISFTFNDFFKGFDHFKELALQQLVVLCMILVFLAPLLYIVLIKMGIWDMIQNAPQGKMDEAESQIFIDTIKEAFTAANIAIIVICSIAIMLIAAFSAFGKYFVVFYGMNFWDGLQASGRLIAANFGYLIVFVIVWNFIIGISVLACFIGTLFTTVAFYCSLYAVFADLTDLSVYTTDGGNDDTKHFIG